MTRKCRGGGVEGGKVWCLYVCISVIVLFEWMSDFIVINFFSSS